MAEILPQITPTTHVTTATQKYSAKADFSQPDIAHA
jgi:hypothetical protein